MQRFTVLFLMSAVLLCTTVLHARETDASESVLPVYLVNDYLVIVQGTIGGIEKRNLLIDTGANPSVITRDLAKKLRLSGPSEPVQAVGRNMNSQVVFLPSLQVGPISVQNLRVLVEDLTELDKKLGLRLDGLVGLDVLAHSNFRIDYHQKKLTFGPVPPLPYSAPMHQTRFMASIDTHVDGESLALLLDTGASDVMLFSPRTAGLAAKSGVPWDITNLAGRFAVRRVELKSLEAAGSDLGPREAFVSERPNAERYPYDGLLALGSERFRQIAFDFEHQVFSWEPAKSRGNTHRIPLGSALALASPALDATPSRATGECTTNLAISATSCGAPDAFPRKRLPLTSR